MSAGDLEQMVTLTWKKFAAKATVPDCVDDMDIQVAIDQLIGAMVIRMKGHVLGEQLPPHTETATRATTFEAPASWWQHFKQQHGHRWWLRRLVCRRPVRTTEETRRLTLTTTWEHMATYPWAEHTTVMPPRFGGPINQRRLTASTDWS